MDFSAFDEPPAPTPAPPPPQTYSSQTTELPSAFSHLRHELIASVAVHGLTDEDRHGLEKIMRDATMRVQPAEFGSDRGTEEATAAPGTVHYFRRSHAASPFTLCDHLL